jgi:hypothetical protein
MISTGFFPLYQADAGIFCHNQGQYLDHLAVTEKAVGFGV